MAAKSPTTSVKLREIIGEDQFTRRREVFDKHATVFLPPHSPTATYRDVDPIVTSNHGKTTANFKRNAPGYSSMRESRTEGNHFDFRPRKYSDNFTSELNQSDDVDYRRSMTERTRRLSKLRRDFLNSNLHDPSNDSPFSRSGTRASLPAKPLTYKIESPNIYKFPFAEPYATPPPVRRVLVDLGPAEIDNAGKENEDPSKNTRHLSLASNESQKQIDHQKLFEELVKRYSPQRKPVDWQLPPTRPRVVASVPKSVTDTDSADGNKILDETINAPADDDVFDKKDPKEKDSSNGDVKNTKPEVKPYTETVTNGPEKVNAEEKAEEVNTDDNKERNSKISLTELAEKNDQVPELSTIQRQLSKDSSTNKRQPLETITDLSIPALLEKMSVEGDNLSVKDTKKVKRKRSFLDKLLGRNKQK